MDRLEAMSIVLLTVERGSLTGAANALNMPLPTISRKVSQLEAYLGTKLLCSVEARVRRLLPTAPRFSLRMTPLGEFGRRNVPAG